jgi:DNA-binding NarL/FixJ family response regulator
MLLIVDDERQDRRVMADTLEALGVPVVEAADATSALAAATRTRPTVVITEVLLPRISGYELCRDVKEQYGADVPVVFISRRRTEPADRVAGFLIGADDYLVKPVDPGELIARVRRLLPAAGTAAERPLAHLTPREHEVMDLLALGRTQTEIAEQLVITPRTVAKHVEHILGKLGVHTRAQAVAMALRRELENAS